MEKIHFNSKNIQIPSECAYCLKQGTQKWTAIKGIFYGDKYLEFSLDFPLCSPCYEKASKTSLAETFAPVVVGLLAAGIWLTFALVLLSKPPAWYVTVGIALLFFFVAWAIGITLVAPYFAPQEIRKIRNSFQISDWKHPDTPQEYIEITVTNAEFGQKLREANPNTLLNG